MNTRLRLLVPVAATPGPGDYLRALLPLQDLRPLALTLFHVRPPSRSGTPETLHLLREAFLRRGMAVDLLLGRGDPAAEILSCARGGRYDWIAMATHARGGLRRTILGSVADQVIRVADVPVLAFRPGVQEGEWRHVAVALDGSPAAEAALADAAALAVACRTPLHLLRFHGLGSEAEARAYLEDVARRLQDREVAALPFVRRGDPVRRILDHARRQDVGLLCLTTRGRRGIRRALRGGVAERVLRRARCPMLVRRAG